jgi:multiple sugar transport system substrate-binding protein
MNEVPVALGGRAISRRSLLAYGGAFAGLAASSGLLAACSTKSSSGGSGGSAAKQGTVTVGLEKGSSYSDFHMKQVAAFEKSSGIKVNFIEVPHDNMHERFLQESLGGGGTIDVFQADQPWVAEFAAAGYLEAIDGKLSATDLADFQQVALDTQTYKGKLYGLPYLVHNSVLYYRTDLFDKAGIKAPPTTWDAYRAAAKELTGGGVFGTVVEGKNGVEPGAKFMDILQQSGGAILDDSGKVAFDSPATVDAFNYMLAVQYDDKSSPPGGPGMDNGDTANLFLQGKLATCPNWPYLYGLGKDPAGSKVVKEYSVALQPGKAKQCAEVFSWGYAISSGSKHKDEAFQFLNWVSSKDMLAKQGASFVNPVPRKSAAAAINSDTTVTDQDRQAIATMSDSVARSQTIPSNAKWPDIHSRVSLALSRIMTKQAGVEKEVSSAANDINKIVGG